MAAPDTESGKTEPTPLTDKYRALAAAAVDKDSDGVISAEEYSDQILFAGGTASDASTQYAKLDSDNDGSVTVYEFTASLEAPTFNMQDALLRDAVRDTSHGTGAAKPSDNVLNAKGQISDPRLLLRYMAQSFADTIKVMPAE
jgi:Ca2+-binding EF-hand superfamily protein